MDITAADVKALREKTGAGMMECKKALTECNGDGAAAEKLLKEQIKPINAEPLLNEDGTPVLNEQDQPMLVGQIGHQSV